MKRYFILTITGLILLTILSQATIDAAPISTIDKLDDVKHVQIIGSNVTVNPGYEKPYIDIYKITYRVLNDTIDLYMVLNGTIKNDNSTSYILFYNTTEAIYKLDYRNGVNYGYAEEKNISGIPQSIKKPSQNISLYASGERIQVTYQTIKDPSNKTDFWGYAMEENTQDNISEIWVDFIPDSYSNFENYNGSNETDNNIDNNGNKQQDDQNKTPSLNFSMFLIALIFIICVKIRKKQLHKR